MPFLGKDWRSCGEHWIRTEHGWERTKVLECILDNLNIGLRKDNTKKKIRQERRNNNNSESNDDDTLEENNCDESMEQEEEEDHFLYDELSMLSEDEDSDESDEKNNNSVCPITSRPNDVLSKLCISNSQANYKTRQPHIIYLGIDLMKKETQVPNASVSEVLNALDMPGAVRDIKRFNYVCRLVQLIINEKLHQLSGNAQKTLFLIVKQMLIQVIKTQENLNVMRKLLFDFNKKIQDSFYYYFYYIGSQKLCEKHLATISKWQEMLDNPNHKRVKRLANSHIKRQNDNLGQNASTNNNNNNSNKENKTSVDFDSIPVDCKLEIMRRLNTGLDLVNLSKCNKSLNNIISKELAIWKNLCQFHYQQTHINSFLRNKTSKNTSGLSDINSVKDQQQQNIGDLKSNDLDWKQIYFKLKRRYGHREVYADMIHKCYHCKCLFWKEIGHPCVILASLGALDPDSTLEMKTEPITPKKLMDLLLR